MLLVPPEQHLQNSLAVAALLKPAAPKLRAKERGGRAQHPEASHPYVIHGCWTLHPPVYIISSLMTIVTPSNHNYISRAHPHV